MLDELGEDVSAAQAGMDRVTSAIGKLLKTKGAAAERLGMGGRGLTISLPPSPRADNCQICTVFWLVILLCVLTVLVFTI